MKVTGDEKKPDTAAVSRWIWYPGEYELYQNLLLHTRRQEYGVDYPCFWSTAALYPRVNFFGVADCARGGEVRFFVRGTGYVFFDGVQYGCGTKISFAPGRHRIVAVVLNAGGLPALFADSDVIVTDGTWYATPGTYTQFDLDTAKESPECRPVGCVPAYTDPAADLSVFPFREDTVFPVSVQKDGAYTVYDFGKETFGKLSFTSDSETVTAVYGESYEEATSFGLAHGKNALVYETVTGAGKHTLASRAFRYISLLGAAHDVFATSELLPLSYTGDFVCDDPTVKRIFDTCAYTFHLCAREFFLDGIKRDRWCWSGDAYQSYLINDYLFSDRETTKRTITALLGKPPYFEHINTINDYSALLLIGAAEYVQRSGDVAFLSLLWERIKALYGFIVSRLDARGYVVRTGDDWVFIDWSDIDKTGAVAAEQILLWQVCRSMAQMAAYLGDADVYSDRAAALHAAIEKDFYRADCGGYIDSCDAPEPHVTRHANIFAILFDFCDKERAEVICRSVLENDGITQITTPYFGFYELLALCKMGRIEAAQRKLVSYWGGMLKLGATTVWEAYDPAETGAGHYAMYGSDYGKSLCHAWGAGPVCFLGRYCAGVRSDTFGSERFTVAPNPGLYTFFRAKVPMPGGAVEVLYEKGHVTVTTDLAGGTLIFGGQEKEIRPGTPCTV